MESPTYAIVDLETTGHSPEAGDRMIQIAIVLMKNWEIQKTFTSFINPGKPIPLFIQDLTNISDKDVENAKTFKEIAQQIYDLLNGTIFVAHNVDFDLSFLQSEFKRAGLPRWKGKKIDTVELSKILFPTSLSYQLGELASDLNIQHGQAHRADYDAVACALLLKKCWEKMLTFPLATLELLHKKSFHLKSNISHLLFEAIQRKRIKVSDESNFLFYKNIALKKVIPKHNIKNVFDGTYPEVENEKVALLSKAIDNFEIRKGQFSMMNDIWLSLHEKKEIVIEASTGIGKTIGYLLPVAYYAKLNNKKVCISTYTTYLLDQLLENEIPKVEKIIQSPLHVSILKGMHNYIDLSIFEQIIHGMDLSYDETLTALQVIVWLLDTETGDLGELNVSGGGQLFLDKIRKTKDRKACEVDFYDRAIKNSENAEMIVTNHAMLMAELVRKNTIFHAVDGWVIDEAHQFVQAAISQDESVFSYMNWKYIFGKIGVNSEIYTEFRKVALKKQLVPYSVLEQLEKKYHFLIHLFDDTILEIVNEMGKRYRYSKIESKQTAFLSELSLNLDLFKRFSNLLQSWIDLAQLAAKRFSQNFVELEKEDIFLLEKWEYWINECKIKLSEWDSIFIEKSDTFSTWVEMDQKNVPSSIYVLRKPMNVKENIKQLVDSIREKSGIIWTSSTLTVPNNKHFVADQLGICDNVPIQIYESPSSYYKGAQVFIVSDMPDIQNVPQKEFVESITQAITRIVKATDGRCFVLFTSLDMLKNTYELIQDSELLQDYMIFAQAITSGSRMRLLKSFQKFSKSVLFGTNTFWEGVDVPGEGLATVIIVRLPFSSPEDPVFKAKSIALQLQGMNAFTNLSLPEAILRFKQGFGRLIRSSNDKGAFIVLDRRIESKSYGKQFLNALPNITIQKLPLSDMVQELEHWYNKKR